MDVYFEQSVANSAIDKHLKRTKVLMVVRVVLLIIGLILASIILFAPVPGEEVTIAATIMFIVFWIFLAAPFIFAFFFIAKIINKMNLEYDYYINGSTFRIVKVINRKERKKMIETSISNFESIGRVTSDTYDRYASAKEIKQQFALCDVEDEEDVIYIYYVADGVKHLLHIQPNDEMIVALRQSIGRITVLDKSLKVPRARKEKEEEA